MLFGSVGIFLAVSAVLILALTNRSLKSIFSARRLIVWGGIVIPAFALSALIILAFFVGERLIARSGDPDDLLVEVSARQWSWDFYYRATDGTHLTTRDVLHIPAGRNIRFVVTSADVIHSFWIPRLGGKIDAIPGRTNIIWLKADRPGTYGGICAEFCGDGHPNMYFTVEAHSEQEFEAVLTAMKPARRDE
jgi:cytochrome c oxidase subunit 2